ncbi:Sterol regulatory element-binding protein cleavage-activating protein [Zootermopsis nevadensis]|uniref:Sterol regulatory element-binding protein cleavage-activating protein n=2 Tax=Zootermopsis nevadensis TaxID=136037 RepID=A0A067REF2_ZOONE|nr:Sterol regulatory element-binding protein cleavage-activating protein [Zootermopsis nevadensis]
MGCDPWRRLSHYHWPAILSLYNISLSGHYISILPPIRLSHAVSSEQARALRNPNEKAVQHFQWHALAAALDPLDFSDGGETGNGPRVSITSVGGSVPSGEVPFVPSSPMELFLTAVLCIISIVVLAYTMVMLYRCVCSRNYAEWRASWAGDGESVTSDGTTQVVMEAVPLVLDGHPQEVECLATDGSMVVSSCLGGQLRVWDSISGEALAVVDRRIYFLAMQRDPDTADLEEPPLSDYESGSPPSRGERTGMGDDSSPLLSHHKKHSVLWNLPDLRPVININFTGNKVGDCDASNQVRDVCTSGFDFTSRFQNLYEEHRKSLESDVNEDGSWSSPSVKEAHPNKPAVHLQNIVSSPSKRTLETMVSKSCQCQDPGDICGIIQHQKFQGGASLCDAERYKRDVSGSKCCDKVAPQALESVSSDCSSFSPDSYHRRQTDTDFYEVLCGVDSANLTADHSSPVNTGSTSSRAAKAERRQPRALCHVRESLTVGCCAQQTPPIWCLDCHENLIAVGCASGRLEFWEGSTGTFKCLFEDGSGVGITSVKIIGNRVVAAKLSGVVDFLELESYSYGRQMDWGFTAYRRTHVRSGSTGSIMDWNTIRDRKGSDEDLRCIQLKTVRAHQQPITVLDSEGGRVLTGSKDHTLKVFRLEDQLPLYTLHGHSGPVTCLFMDRISPMMSGSGSQDGLLCVWDLLTGACMYSLQAHDGSVMALTYSASYVISLGTDDRLCVWERFQGHLLNTIQVSHTYCTSMVMLTHNLLITSKQGSLVVWDVRTGDAVRVVKLGDSDGSVFVKQILLLRDSVACDYSNQLRIVHFPLVLTDKCE